jgi:hypothetical protein
MRGLLIRVLLYVEKVHQAIQEGRLHTSNEVCNILSLSYST